MTKKEYNFTVAIDTREQLPYTFLNTIKTKRKTLKTGDYSIIGHEQNISIERKSKADIYQSIGKGRKRFEREIKRLSCYDLGGILIEASVKDLLKTPPYTIMNPKSVINTLISWRIKYDVDIFFVSENRLYCEAFLLNLFKFYLKHAKGK